MSESKTDKSYELDSSTPLFTSDGSIEQIKNAETASNNGDLSISKHFNSQDSNFIITASLKNLPKLVKKQKIQKLKQINEKILLTFSGVSTDFVRILNIAYSLSESYYQTYNEQINVSRFVKELSSRMQSLTNQSNLRPFGVKLIVCGFNENIEQQKKFEVDGVEYFNLKENVEAIELYEISPNGSFKTKSEVGTGKFGEKSVEFLKKRGDLEKESGLIEVFKCLKEFSQLEITEEDFEICIISEDTKSIEILDVEKNKELMSSF